ncbi:hypothetical protein EX30DRAFT_286802, partial [Ascodesmis nigricans]
TARLTLCAVSSFVGLQLLAWCENIGVRVMGIAAASLSSNLGDMSFFQLATRYPTMITQSMGGYAAGSGAAGLIGSFVYTLLTGASVGASPSLVLSGVGIVPAVMLLVYFLVLPKPSTNSVSKGGDSLIGDLGLADKLRLVGPLIWGYMAPLAALMFLENITTQGILPTILYHLPLPSPLSTLFTIPRDFYPFFFTTYQLAIFLGRSSITLFRLPGHNRGSCAAYWALVAVESLCLLALLTHSISMALPSADDGVARKIAAVAGCVFIMGLCGGLGMSNTYWRFLISTIALPDVAAIFVASLLSLWVQPALCQLQVGAGRGGC